MDFGKVLGRAWEITWRWKVLWILGFLASLGNGGGGGGNFYSTSGEDFSPDRWAPEMLGPDFWAAVAGGVLALVCLGLLIAIVVWVVSIIARGGLIAGVQQVEEEGSTSFGQAWRVGFSRFWTLFGIAVLAAIPFLILMFGLFILFVLGIVVAGGVSEFSEAASGASVLTMLLCGGVFCCGLIIIGLVLDQIRTYAERAAILEGLGWIDAFQRGWQVIVENLGPTVLLWLIFFAIGLVLVVVVMAGLAIIGLPLVAIFGTTDPEAWVLAPICCGGLLAFIVFALIGAIVETFTSATWTLAYRELTGLAQRSEVEAALEAALEE